jgi:hypothetical protein
MVRLSRLVLGHIVADQGTDEVLARLSDPFWFQALGCVLGFDWHSSGLTTTTCGAIKEAARGCGQDLGFYVAGGKGRVSRRTPAEITAACEDLGFEPDGLVHASRAAAKVDNSAVQSGHQLYHHVFVFTAQGKWCIVQQGMNGQTRTARRYHWLGEHVADLVQEPHEAVCDNTRGVVLNYVAGESAKARDVAAELARGGPGPVIDALDKLPSLMMGPRHEITDFDIDHRYLEKTLLRTYEQAPKDFEALLCTEGVGPKTLRALSLVGELIYGTPTSTRDPARFAFAHGGKDGTPYPVDRPTYERTIEVLHDALVGPKAERGERMDALKRLARFAGTSLPVERVRKAGTAGVASTGHSRLAQADPPVVGGDARVDQGPEPGPLKLFSDAFCQEQVLEDSP